MPPGRGLRHVPPLPRFDACARGLLQPNAAQGLFRSERRNSMMAPCRESVSCEVPYFMDLIAWDSRSASPAAAPDAVLSDMTHTSPPDTLLWIESASFASASSEYAE